MCCCTAHHGMLRLSLAMFASPPRSRSNRVGRPVLGCSGVEITCSDGDDPGGESDELPRRVGSELSIGRSVCCADPESCARRSLDGSVTPACLLTARRCDEDRIGSVVRGVARRGNSSTAVALPWVTYKVSAAPRWSLYRVRRVWRRRHGLKVAVEQSCRRLRGSITEFGASLAVSNFR